MDNSISPFLRIPVSDLTGGLLSHQTVGSRCGKQEMEMAVCIEAYGLERGRKKCYPLIEEYKECHMLTKQFKRFIAMRDERDRQIKCGILTGDKKYVSPKVDSY